jgi:hypothetical protein
MVLAIGIAGVEVEVVARGLQLHMSRMMDNGPEQSHQAMAAGRLPPKINRRERIVTSNKAIVNTKWRTRDAD